MSSIFEDFLGDSYDPNSQVFDSNKAILEANEKKDKFNILLFGATGVGKSALVNSVFGSNIVESRAGSPVTQGLEKINVPRKGLTLWDTKGIEAKDYEETINLLRSEIRSGFENNHHVDDVPHLGWMCIDGSGSRIEDRDIELIGILKEFNIPIVVVFTKYIEGDSDNFINEAITIINQHHGDYVSNNYVRVNSQERKTRYFTIPVSGLNELIDSSFKCLTEAKVGIREALKKAQMVKTGLRLEAMKNGSRNIVHAASAAAGVVGATPIPGSDAVLISAVQSMMIYKINSEFELDVSTSTTTSVIAGVLGTTALAQVGKSVVSSTLKFIPVAGSFIGGAISSITAAAITQAVGHAYIQVLDHYYNKDTGFVELPESSIEILKMFKDNFTHYKHS